MQISSNGINETSILVMPFSCKRNFGRGNILQLAYFYMYKRK